MTEGTAVITGGSRGIGYATAVALAESGADIAIVAKSPECPSAVEEIEKYGVRCRYYSCDVSVSGETAGTVREIINDFGHIDVLVNDAGIIRDGLLVNTPEESFDEVMNVNLRGTYNMIKACIRHFMSRRYGRIINISSVAGLSGNAGQTNYSASKAGVIGLTKSVAREYAGRGITCNAVAPGYIDTDMTRSVGEETKKKMIFSVPVKRMGTPEEVARVIRFLAEDTGYITGEVIKIDGGLYI